MFFSIFHITSTVPDAPALTFSTTSVSTVLLSWSMPNAGLSPVLGFRLSYIRAENFSDSFTEVELGENEWNYTVSSLSAGGLYLFRLAARGAWGYGPSAEVTVAMPEDVATTASITAVSSESAQTHGFLLNLTAGSVGSTSLTLRWEEPRTIGPIQGYRVWYALTYSNGTDIAMETEVVEPAVVLTGLKADTEYVVRVCVVNDDGPGPYSPPLYTRTQPLEEGRTHPDSHTRTQHI